MADYPRYFYGRGHNRGWEIPPPAWPRLPAAVVRGWEMPPSASPSLPAAVSQRREIPPSALPRPSVAAVSQRREIPPSALPRPPVAAVNPSGVSLTINQPIQHNVWFNDHSPSYRDSANEELIEETGEIIVWRPRQELGAGLYDTMSQPSVNLGVTVGASDGEEGSFEEMRRQAAGHRQ